MGLLPDLDAQAVLALHCPLCSYHTHWVKRLESHFSEQHKTDYANLVLFQCTQCQKVASSKAFLQEHLAIHHKLGRESPFPRSASPSVFDGLPSRPSSVNCPPSEATPYINQLFSGHLSGSHYASTLSAPTQAPKKPSAIRQRCVFCSFSFKNSSEMGQHYANHGIVNVPHNTNSSMSFIPATSVSLGLSLWLLYH
ncbi:hypothetical protein Ciccas_001499 [Cichlidogyrus casuarinus]|uniref:C2H2-type domain-containing protein n=1 Tax=Cichlidogyrus casuarinus TaxID=1844966 RepID=A0ABD2QJZ7_9PLAT